MNELRQPQTISGQRYDTLIIAERHDLLDVLRWEDTVRYTRHFHDRLVEGNSKATTYVYHAWLSLPNKSAPANWISFEKAVAPAWQCVASRINHSLSFEGRSDRVAYLPAGLALAQMVEQATTGSGLPGVTGSSVRETVDRIFADSVHLTALGSYYMGLVNYASVYRRSPVGAWAPSGVTPTQALSLQTAAWKAVSDHFNNYSAPDLAQCRAVMRDSVCSVYNNFRNTQSETADCVSFFTNPAQRNPFYFVSSTDKAYWFPAP